MFLFYCCPDMYANIYCMFIMCPLQKVLDLRFNVLTSLHPLTHLSLRNIEVDVRLDGNRWQCDFRMCGVKRRMADDSSRGLHAWNVVCATPSALSGRDLLQLDDDELQCFEENRPRLHPQDLTVRRGSEILFSCSAQGNDAKYVNSIQIQYSLIWS